MRRNPDLSRVILLFVEEHSPPQGGLDLPLEIPAYDRQTVLAHTELLIEDGLVDGRVLRAVIGFADIAITKLTSAGHEAIAATRNDAIWEEAKKFAIKNGIELTIGALAEVSKAEGRKRLERL